MRIRSRRILLYTLLGVVTNLVIAWACSALASHWRTSPRIDQIAEPFDRWPQAWQKSMHIRVFWGALVRPPGVEFYSWQYQGPTAAPGVGPSNVLWGDARVPNWSSIHNEQTRDGSMSSPMSTPMIDWRAGWPLSTLRGRLTPESLGQWQEKFQVRDGMLRLRDSVARVNTGTNLSLSGHLFPLLPIWPGIIANSALFGAAWFGTLAGASVFLRRRRRHKTRCLSCGYDLHGLTPGTPCPECGPRRSANRANISPPKCPPLAPPGRP